VYLDTVFVFFGYILEKAINAHPDRVIFGSDAPAAHPAVALASINCLAVSNAHKDMVLGGNIGRLVQK
jgi:predicted TIM-barrel fold metal-dependent hydrolase